MSAYYTCAEAAKILGVIPRRVIQLIDEGKLKAEKIGYMWMIHVDDLQREVNKRREGQR